MSYLRRCDGCQKVVDSGPKPHNWLLICHIDEDGDLEDKYQAHVCSWQCLVTLAMDAGELFPDVVTDRSTEKQQ